MMLSDGLEESFLDVEVTMLSLLRYFWSGMFRSPAPCLRAELNIHLFTQDPSAPAATTEPAAATTRAAAISASAAATTAPAADVPPPAGAIGYSPAAATPAASAPAGVLVDRAVIHSLLQGSERQPPARSPHERVKAA